MIADNDPSSTVQNSSTGEKHTFLAMLNSTFKKSVQRLKGRRLFYLEVFIISAWIIALTYDYFDFNPRLTPIGREYLLILQNNYIWTLLPKCGSCVFWNGFLNGGMPSFVDLHGSSLHPLTIITTLLFGVVNGGKALIIGSVCLGAIAQWWIAKVMGLGRVTRVWSACLAAAGGHLAGRMEVGNVGLVLSLSSATLVLATMLDLAMNKEKTSPVGLGVSLGLLALAGQGYYQFGIGVIVLVLIFVFYFESKQSVTEYLKKYIQALILALLLAGFFLVPFLHFLPNIIKESDPYLSQIQGTEYTPLNLVIQDIGFFQTDLLGKTLNPYLHINYIGWIPIIFAGFAIRLVPRTKKHLLAALLISLGVIFLISGKEFYQVLMNVLPSVQIMRNASLIAGLAVPLIVALAAWGVELIRNQNWGKLVFMRDGSQKGGLTITWLVIGSMMVISLFQVFKFSHSFLYQIKLDVPSEAVEALKTPSAQWVQPPYGEYFWLEDMFAQDSKIARVFRPWGWKNRELPLPYLELTNNVEDMEKPGFKETVGDLFLIESEGNEYASIETEDGNVIPCAAAAKGGNIDVVCDSSQGGVLTVKENNYSGWKAKVNNQKVKLIRGDWLSISLPPGHQTISFRYRPLDVIVGIILTILGIALSVWMTIQFSAKRRSLE